MESLESLAVYVAAFIAGMCIVSLFQAHQRASAEQRPERGDPVLDVFAAPAESPPGNPDQGQPSRPRRRDL